MERDRWKGWMRASLLGGAVVELVNLFALAVTQGSLQLPAFSADRFTSFAVHALICWLFLAAREIFYSAARDWRHSATRLLVLALCLAGAQVYFQHGIRLSADGPHYFVQARSLLFDGDLDFANDYERVQVPKPIAERYPVGMGLLSLPFLLLAHLMVLIQSGQADGFGYAYETAFGLGSYFLGSLGLLFVLRTVSRFFPTGMSFLSLVTLWASSFLLWYMVIEPAMPNTMSFAFSSFFLGYWLAKRPFRGARDWVILGVLVGVAALVRWQNVVLLALPVIDHLLDSPKSAVRAGWAAATAMLVFVPQLIFWHLTSGSAFAVPLEGHAVDWKQLSFWEVLFSSNRGLFTWNPSIYLATLGLFVWAIKERRLASLFLLGVLLQVYVNSNVGIWWAGWSYGGRRFDSCVVFFVIGAAAIFEFLRRRPMILVLGLCGFFMLWSFGLMSQSRSGQIPPDRLVSFRDVSVNNVQAFHQRFGYAAAAPLNWLFARRYQVSPEKFDRLFGHEGFGNLRLPFDAGSEAFMARGWGDPEMGPGRRWFRWSVGREAAILLPLKMPHTYELTVELAPYVKASPNRVWLRVNGQLDQERALAGGETTLTWRLGERLWRPGINELRFFFQRTARPSDVSSSPDSRELGAAFYHLKLIALPDPP